MSTESTTPRQIAAILGAAYLRFLAKRPRVGHLARPEDSQNFDPNRLAISASDVAHVRATRAVNPCPLEED